MSEENVELVREILGRFAAGDPHWARRPDPQISWDISAHPLPDVPNTGRGREEFLDQVIATYTSGWRGCHSELSDTIDAGNDVVVVVHEWANLAATDAVLDRDLVQVWTVDEGSVTLFRVFPSRSSALEAAGLSDEL